MDERWKSTSLDSPWFDTFEHAGADVIGADNCSAHSASAFNLKKIDE